MTLKILVRDQSEHPTREAVSRLLDEGKGTNEIASILGLGKPVISYHRKKLGRPHVFGNVLYLYDWCQVQQDIDAGVSIKSIQKKHGFCAATYYKQVKNGVIKSNPPLSKLPTDLGSLLKKINGRLANSHIKNPIKSLIFQEQGGKCLCGVSDWNGKELVFDLDHIDGKPTNYVRENLRVLCPNCHRQTETWGNKKRK